MHEESIAALARAADRGEPLAAPSMVLLETLCALARRLGDTARARAAGARLVAHPILRLEPLTDALLALAVDVGTERRLRAADALYAATAVELDALLLSWDRELIERAGALSPREWLRAS